MSHHHNQTLPYSQLVSLFIITLLLIYYPIRHTLCFAPAFPTLLSLPPRKAKPPKLSLRGLLNKCLAVTYFHMGIHTIIGAESFHGPVRDGKAWDQLAMAARLKLYKFESRYEALLCFTYLFVNQLLGDDVSSSVSFILMLCLSLCLRFCFSKSFK